MVVTRGVVHVETMPPDWHLDGNGLAEFVERLPAIVRRMVGDGTPMPRVVFTDRGTGMHTSLGVAVHAYFDAVRRAGFRTYWGG